MPGAAVPPPAAHAMVSEADLEAVDALAEGIKGNSSQNSLDALNELCDVLERAERQYQELIGDPQINPGQRVHYPIGILLRRLESADVMHIHDSWTFNREASLEQRVGGMRLLFCLLQAGHAQPPLEELISSLKQWTVEDTNKRQTRGDQQADHRAGMAREACRAYAASLLAIALAEKDTCEDTVRSGIIADFARYLNRAVPRAAPAQPLPQPAVNPGCPLMGAQPADHSPILATPAAPLEALREHGSLEYIPAAGSAICIGRPAQRTLLLSPEQGPLEPSPDHLGGAVDDTLLLRAAMEMDLESPPASPCREVPAASSHNGTNVLQRAEQVDRLRLLRMRGTVQCCACMGEYQECLGPLMAEGIVEVVLTLLADWRARPVELVDALRLLCALLAHRKFAEQLVEGGGVQLLLSLPHSQHTRGFVSLALFCLASIPQALDRMCALPSPVPEQLVDTALTFLASGFDPARRNAAQFLAIALRSRCIVTEFDRQGGLKRVLSVLRALLVLLKGASNDIRMDKQVGYHATVALQQYFSTNVVAHATAMKRRLPSSSPSTSKQSPGRAMRALSDSAEPLEEAISILEHAGSSSTVSTSMMSWIEPFLRMEGCCLMLQFVDVSPGEKYFNEMALHALTVLRIATLEIAVRRAVVAAVISRQRPGMTVLLSAASGQAFSNDYEVMHAALLVIANLVRGPEQRLLASAQGSAADDAAAPGGSCAVQEEGTKLASAARAAVRAAGGIRILINLLSPRACPPATGPDLRAVAVSCLLGLARDPSLCSILSRLQVARLLAELVHEPSSGASSAWRRAASDGPAATVPPTSCPHASFNKSALQLISLTTGGLGAGSGAAAEAHGPALHRLEREAIAAATQISYPQSELMMLIHEHLQAKGLHAAASALAQEAGLAGGGLGESKPPLQRDLMPAMDVEAGSRQGIDTSSAGRGDAGPLLLGGLTPTLAGSTPAQKRTLTVAPALLQSIAKMAPGDRSAAKPAADSLQKAPLDDSARRHETMADDGPRVQGAEAVTSGVRKRLADDAACSGDEGGVHPSTSSRPAKRARADRGTPMQGWGCRDLGPGQVSSTPQQHPTGRPQLAPWRMNCEHQRSKLLERLPGRRPPPQTCATPRQPLRPGREPAPPPSRALTHRALASPPDRACTRPAAKAHDPGADSRLSGIVMQYLRQQHRQACLQAPVPIATLPPLSLLTPTSIPEAKRCLDAPLSVVARLRQRQIAAPHGGHGGRRRERHQQFGSFRQVRSLRDADAALLRSCAFVQGDANLAVGCNAGSLQIMDVCSGALLSASDSPHSMPINQIRVWEGSGKTHLLSSTRSDVRLWHNFELSSFTSYAGVRHGTFHPQGQHMAAIAVGNSTAARQACLWDINRPDAAPWTLEDAGLGTAAAATANRLAKDALCFSKAGELLLHGPLLWDWRTPRAIHCFDVFSETPGSSSFHPYGLEVILNSEVWDLRMLRLLRSVPCLDGTVLTWAGSGEAAFASLRRGSDDLHTPAHARRTRHALHTAFRTVDASGYAEISTVGMDGRMVLDLATEASDTLVAVATAEPHELASSSVRVFKIGARPLLGDDAEDDEGMSGGSEHGDESEDEEDEDDTSSPWRGMSAELAALSTPGSVGMRGRSRGPPPAPRDGSDAGGTSSHDGEGGDEVQQQEESAGDDGSQRGSDDASFDGSMSEGQSADFAEESDEASSSDGTSSGDSMFTDQAD